MNEQDTIKSQTEELLKLMSFNVTVEVTQQDNIYNVILKTEDDPALLIGRHGQTLRSIDRVLSTILFQKFGHKVELLLDINDYRATQKTRLEGIAENIAQRVMQTKQPSQLSSFSAYERKLLHEYISATHPELATHSEGEGISRVLVVEVKS